MQRRQLPRDNLIPWIKSIKAKNKQAGYHRKSCNQTDRTKHPCESVINKKRDNRARSLFDLEQLDVEDQLGVGGNAGEGLLAVSKLGRNGETALSTGGHAGNTDVPTLDDLTTSELEGERLALLVGVEDLAVLKLADVAHGNSVTALGGNTLSKLLVVNLDTTDLLHAEGAGGLVTGGSRTLLEVLGELNLLVGLGLLLVGLGLLGLNSGSITVVLLQLLLLGLGQNGLLLGGLALGALGDQVIKGLLFGGTLVLALALGLNQLGGLLLLAVNLGDAGVIHAIKVITLLSIHGQKLLHVELLLIGGKVVVILIILILIVVVTALVETNDVVTGEVNSVVTGDLEEDTLTLTHGDVKGLLAVLFELLVIELCMII